MRAANTAINTIFVSRSYLFFKPLWNTPTIHIIIKILYSYNSAKKSLIHFYNALNNYIFSDELDKINLINLSLRPKKILHAACEIEEASTKRVA